MIHFFINEDKVTVVEASSKLSSKNIDQLVWLLDYPIHSKESKLLHKYIGPRKEMISPFSTNAVEITSNMGIKGIKRIEEFFLYKDSHTDFDPMLQEIYEALDQDIFRVSKSAEAVRQIDDLVKFNNDEGLALNKDEILYLESLSEKLGRKLTDSEVFGFSQVNSEHCRHKIFNGKFIIDGEEQPYSLFQMIKSTSEANPNKLVSAYKDNCSFNEGPVIEQFAPAQQDKADYFMVTDIESVLSLKAETHNFPTTVEPFNGAATGSGGEIRDRMAGGKGSIPMAGTAVYMTSYPRLSPDRPWEKYFPARKWLYQSPDEILIKASNGASDFGNKFGQPLICGSLMTFEYSDKHQKLGYDKVIMLAGGIGYGKKEDSLKSEPQAGDIIVVLGGDNYRIGMGGGAVSSVATGEYDNTIELNAVQRSNPEMQKRVFNVIRAFAEKAKNPIISIHDHGAGGHLNSLSELVENSGGEIDITKLPIGDPTLSAKEIMGNESQERMGLLIKEDELELLKRIAERERAPLYIVGKVSGDKKFKVVDSSSGEYSIDLSMEDMFGKTPKTVLNDQSGQHPFRMLDLDTIKIYDYLELLVQMEAVACKDWLTNKVDRSVTGKIAHQQTTGPIQLPLNNLGAVALDYKGVKGYATAIGHAPVSSLIDPGSGAIISVAEALTNLVWAPLPEGLGSVSLSANWMWPARSKGEDARLYKAVESLSEFAKSIGVNVPTGKDSLSMTQKYPDGSVVKAPGTVIVSAAAEVEDIKKIVTPDIKLHEESAIIYVDFSKDNFKLGGSSFAQLMGSPGNDCPCVNDSAYFIRAFETIQNINKEGHLLAGHDISAGGLLVCLLEMCFSRNDVGLDIDFTPMRDQNPVRLFFSENPGVIIQVKDVDSVAVMLEDAIVDYKIIGRPTQDRKLRALTVFSEYEFDIDSLRDLWFKTSYLFDCKQSKNGLALKRYKNYKKQSLMYRFNSSFTGLPRDMGLEQGKSIKRDIKAAIIREKGVNGDREMAAALYAAGFNVKDVHMTDLISGRETLEDINFIVFVGGFSNSDVMGSAKGWAGAFIYNPKAKESLDNFFAREDTLSLGVCNGCQLMMALGLVNPPEKKAKMKLNKSGKFESAFINVNIMDNHSVMLSSMAGCRLGIWIAHAEGQFDLELNEDAYHIPLKYSYSEYPANPNGSTYDTAALCSDNGRHLAMMPHLERAFLPWQWAHYPEGRDNDQVSPWLQAFVNAKNWIVEKTKK